MWPARRPAERVDLAAHPQLLGKAPPHGVPMLAGELADPERRGRIDLEIERRLAHEVPPYCPLASAEEDASVHTRIGDGVIQIDTLLGGWERMTAGYLVEGDAPVLVETGSQSSVAGAARCARRAGHGPRRPRRGGRHPHPPRPRRRRRRCGQGVSEGDRLRAREGRPPPRRPRAARALGGDGLRRSARLALRAARAHGAGAHPRARGRRGDQREPDARAHDRRLARPRQAPPRAARLDERHLVRRATQWACACPTPACCGRPRPRPTSTSTWRSARCTSSSIATPPRSRSRTTASCPNPIDTLQEAEGILRQWAEVAEAAFREGRDIAEALDVAFSGAARGHRPGAPREARDVERGALERRGLSPLARATAGPRAPPLPLRARRGYAPSSS